MDTPTLTACYFPRFNSKSGIQGNRTIPDDPVTRVAEALLSMEYRQDKPCRHRAGRVEYVGTPMASRPQLFRGD